MVGAVPRTFADEVRQQAFERDGFVVVELLDPDEVREVQALVDGLFRGGSEGFHATNMLPNPEYRREVWDVLRPVLEPRAGALLAGYEACTAALMIKFPGEDSGFIPHQDWSLVDEARYRSVNIWIPLVDVDERNGALRVLPGSHKVLGAVRCSPAPPVSHQPPGWHVPMEDLQPLVMRAGQAVVFDHALLHGSDPNRSAAVRPAVTIAMKPADADLLHWYVPDLGRDDLETYRIDADYLVDFELGRAPDYPRVATGTYVPDRIAPAEIAERSRRA